MNMDAPLGSISVETFLKDYWQKKPLLIRQAIPDFSPPVTADELAGLACEPDVESRLIRFDAKEDHWSLEQGPFPESRFAELPDSQWTLLVQAVDHWIPEAADLVERFRFIPSWRVDDLMISYAAPGGGVGPHYDNYDVFLLQASGTRRWELGGVCTEDSPRRPDAPVMILPEWKPDQSYDLEPGDMLYLPPQIAHNGYAVGDDCMTYSIGFRAPAHNEILRSFSDFVGEKLGREIRYADPDLSLQTNPGQIGQDALNRVQAILASYLKDEAQIARWFGRYMTEPKYPELEEVQEPPSIEELQQWLAQDIPLRRNEGARFAYLDKADEASLFANGEHYPLTCETLPLAEALCLRNDYTPVQLPNLNRDALDLLCRLIGAGALYPVLD